MKKALKLFIDMLRISAMRNIAIIALVAVIGFSMAACGGGAGGGGAGGDDGGDVPITYAVTVNGGTGSGNYAAGATVSISATAPSGQTFTNWTVNSGGATLANPTSASTTFTMPANAVIVTANFSGGSSSNLSLNGIWRRGNSSYWVDITVSGNSGKISSINVTDALWNDAINKSYITVGSTQYWWSIASAGNLTWSGQELSVQNYPSSPNVAIGTGSFNRTFTMSSDGQTLTVKDSSGNVVGTYTRQSNYSLDGVWKAGAFQIIVSGNTGVFGTFGTFSAGNAVWEDAIGKNYVSVGSQFWKSITRTDDLTWTGQELTITYNTSSPNVATGTNYANRTFTMSTDGQTLTVGSNTWTRNQ